MAKTAPQAHARAHAGGDTRPGRVLHHHPHVHVPDIQRTPTTQCSSFPSISISISPSDSFDRHPPQSFHYASFDTHNDNLHFKLKDLSLMLMLHPILYPSRPARLCVRLNSQSRVCVPPACEDADMPCIDIDQIQVLHAYSQGLISVIPLKFLPAPARIEYSLRLPSSSASAYAMSSCAVFGLTSTKHY